MHVVAGQEVKIPRGKPALTADAVPTLLPDLPAYLSKEARQKRPERKRLVPCPTEPTKKRRLSRRDVHESSSSHVTVQDENSSLDVTEPSEPASLQVIQDNLSIPKGWTGLNVPDLDGLLYATTSVSKNPFVVTHEKLVMFTNDDAKRVFARLYLHGKEDKDTAINVMEEAADIFKQADSAILCKGAMNAVEYDRDYSKHVTNHLNSSLRIAHGILFSKSCLGAVTGKRKQLSDNSKTCQALGLSAIGVMYG